MDSDHADKMEPWYHFPSPPSEPGYNAYSFSMDSTSLDAEIGIVMEGLKAKLVVTLGNTNPFLRPVREMEEKQISIEELEQDNISDGNIDDYIVQWFMLECWS